jgi:carbon storage regulator CsrA
MLILSRARNESITIGDHIVVTVLEVRGDKVRLGLVVPREMSVHRQEVWAVLRGQEPRAVLVPAWLTWQDGAVVRLARAIAETGDYDALPILADALEDAGCADAGILDHCRSSGRETQRSWVVELILSAS